jgi:hypothetical protein
MNISPLIRQLDNEDFEKLMASLKRQRDRFIYRAARQDHAFEFHIDLPKPDDQPAREMGEWLHDESNFE